MIFRQLFDQSTWTYSYLLADEATGQAVLIDSVNEQVERDLQLISELGLTLVYALDTHIHADHITGMGLLRERTGCQTGLSSQAGSSCVDRQLRDGEQVVFGNLTLTVLHTPGHTNGCASFYCNNKVMTGDALLIHTCGRTDFQQGDPAALYDGIVGKLFTLSDTTEVWPGHDYRGLTVSTISEEKRFNERLILPRDQFIELMSNLKPPMPKKIAEAVPANLACGLPQA